MSILDRIRDTRRTAPRTILAATGIALVGSVPLAVAAGPLNGGARNPSANQSEEFSAETEIIANNNTYGTRQSNKSDKGGGAIYGCRSRVGGTAKGNHPCIRANNLSDGFAFEFQSSNGSVIGALLSSKGGDGVKPFVTNATGVADGLNADRVDGKNASDFAAAGDLLFAAVAANGTAAGRGVKSGSYSATGNTFTVTFDKDVSKCSFTATENDTTASGVSFAAASAGAGKTDQVVVDESGVTATPFHLQVIC